MEARMSEVTERWIDWLSRLQILLPLALVLGIGALVIYPRVSSSNVKLRLISPDGHTTAEVDVSEWGGATEAAHTGVRLRSRFNPFKHYVFVGLDYGAKVTVSWIDSRNLLIKCQNCDKLTTKTEEHKWHDITIHYEIE
jgi:hypothetical protein